MTEDTSARIRLGYISGVFGVRGWVKIHSYAQPRDNIVTYGRWTLVRDGVAQEVEVVDGRRHGKTVIARLAGIDDRDAAAALIGTDIEVDRAQLPACEPGEYYWADLEGLEVQDRDGNRLGRIRQLIETGAHDVVVLDGPGERLLPFVFGEVVESVDLQRRLMTVVWDASYWDDA